MTEEELDALFAPTAPSSAQKRALDAIDVGGRDLTQFLAELPAAVHSGRVGAPEMMGQVSRRFRSFGRTIQFHVPSGQEQDDAIKYLWLASQAANAAVFLGAADFPALALSDLLRATWLSAKGIMLWGGGVAKKPAPPPVEVLAQNCWTCRFARAETMSCLVTEEKSPAAGYAAGEWVGRTHSHNKPCPRDADGCPAWEPK